MGGQGSGRHADPVKARQILAFNNVPQSSEGAVYLPNFMGLQAVKKSDAPIGGGTVTDVSVVTANGFSGTVATSTTTPAITINASALDATKIADGSVTSTEFQYIGGLTSDAQTQLNAKSPTASPTFTGTVTIPTPFTLGAVSVLPTGTELNFVDGVTSAIQTQLDGKAATNATNALYTSGAINVVFVAASGAVSISGGTKMDIVVPFNCTLTSYTLLPDASGSATVEVWKDTYANFPPTVADTMYSGGMVLSAAAKAQDTSLTSWNKTINTGDILRLNVSGSTTTVARLTVALAYTRP